MRSRNDVLSQREIPDAVAYGGWPIHGHAPRGLFDCDKAPRSRIRFPARTISYRSFHSRSMGNLVFAGRNLSASRLAESNARLMGSCSVEEESNPWESDGIRPGRETIALALQEPARIADNHGNGDEHYAPFHGTVDWAKVMKALREIGYRNDFSFEIHMPTAPYPAEVQKNLVRFTYDLGRYLLSMA